MFNPMLDVWASMARSSTWDALPFGFGLAPLAPSQPAAVGNFIDAAGPAASEEMLRFFIQRELT